MDGGGRNWTFLLGVGASKAATVIARRSFELQCPRSRVGEAKSSLVALLVLMNQHPYPL